MTDKIMECITNPAKCKLLLEYIRKDKQPQNIYQILLVIFHKLLYIAI